MINDFEFTQPRDIPEALNALTENGRILPLAGGTNILVYMKRAPLEADLVVDLSRLEALTSVSSSNGSIRLGAGVTFARLLRVATGRCGSRSHAAHVRCLCRPAHPQPGHCRREYLRCVCGR